MIYLISDDPTEKWLLKQLDSFSKDDYRHWELQWFLLSLLATKAKCHSLELQRKS